MHPKNYSELIQGLLFGCALVLFTQAAHADSSAGHVYLSGQVGKQGAIEIPEGGRLTLTQAIITDGGPSDMADLRHIKILRRNSDGTSRFIAIDWFKIMGGGPPDHPEDAHLDRDVTLQPGDTIIVPQRQQNF